MLLLVLLALVVVFLFSVVAVEAVLLMSMLDVLVGEVEYWSSDLVDWMSGCDLRGEETLLLLVLLGLWMVGMLGGVLWLLDSRCDCLHGEVLCWCGDMNLEAGVALVPEGGLREWLSLLS